MQKPHAENRIGARVLFFLTMLYPLVLSIVGDLNYPHHYNPRTGRTRIDAPPLKLQQTFGTAVLMAFWAFALATQLSVVNEISSRLNRIRWTAISHNLKRIGR